MQDLSDFGRDNDSSGHGRALLNARSVKVRNQGIHGGLRWSRAAVALASLGLASSVIATSAEASGTTKPHAAVYNIPQKGIDLIDYDKTSLSDADVATNAAQTMSYIRSLGANSVSIAFPIFISGVKGSVFSTGYGTPSIARLEFVVKAAKTAGLGVSLRPLIDEKNIRPAWRGLLAPTNLTTWFANYGSFLAPYLTMAQKNKVAVFQISNELQSMNSNTKWKTLMTNAAKIFKGELQFTSTFWSQGMNTWPPATFGLDAYTGVNVPPTASVPTLLTAITGVLKKYKLPVATGNVSMTEVGIMAQNGAYLTPSAVSLFGPPSPQALNPAIQANWFTAYCQMVRANKMRGIFFWTIVFPGVASAPADLLNPARFTPAGVTAIKNCFAGK